VEYCKNSLPIFVLGIGVGADRLSGKAYSLLPRTRREVGGGVWVIDFTYFSVLNANTIVRFSFTFLFNFLLPSVFIEIYCEI